MIADETLNRWADEHLESVSVRPILKLVTVRFRVAGSLQEVVSCDLSEALVSAIRKTRLLLDPAPDPLTAEQWGALNEAVRNYTCASIPSSKSSSAPPSSRA